MATNIYILRLRDGRYYVGKTDNITKRFQQHVKGYGSAWTKKYAPIEIARRIEGASPYDEDRYVKEYMGIYGIQNVRGGSYVQMNLTDAQEASLKMEIRGANDKCINCGCAGHFIKYCYAKTEVNLNELDESSDESSDDDEWECEYCDRTFTTKYGCSVHERSCKQKSTKSTKSTKFTKFTKFTKPPSTKSNNCYRCGKSGHYSSYCYATWHKNGYQLD